MGYLVVYSETGVPHSGCVLISGGKAEWLSFMPKPTSFWDTFPGGNYGWVDTSSREDAINSYVSMFVSDGDLNKGRNDTLTKYYSATYGLFINDCITFSRDMVKNCKLSGGSGVSFFPGVFVTQLYLTNQGVIQSYNAAQYPWAGLKKK